MIVFRACTARGEWVRTFMPSATGKAQLGTRPRWPSTSTTHMRQAPVAVRPSMWHSVGTRMPARRSALEQHFALLGGNRAPVDFDGNHGWFSWSPSHVGVAVAPPPLSLPQFPGCGSSTATPTIHLPSPVSGEGTLLFPSAYCFITASKRQASRQEPQPMHLSTTM